MTAQRVREDTATFGQGNLAGYRDTGMTAMMRNHANGRHRRMNTRESWERTGSTPTHPKPWYLDADAMFDSDMSRGYHGGPLLWRLGDNPWALVDDADYDLTDAEQHAADPDPDEMEDWDLGPVRHAHRPGWEDADFEDEPRPIKFDRTRRRRIDV